jgi:diguanylate cyclase (GGDEF)-like protein
MQSSFPSTNDNLRLVAEKCQAWPEMLRELQYLLGESVEVMKEESGRVKATVARSGLAGPLVSSIMIDIDFFKNYNDTYGHLAGDDCLKKVAGTLARLAARTTDLVARHGGEEFAVILLKTSAEHAAALAERMRHGVRNLWIEHSASKVGKSVTSVVPDPQTSPDEIMSQADDALYEAKDAGRNRVVAFSPSAG